MISGDTRQTPNEGQTAGSQSVENSGTALRMACAEARAILIDLAAKRLGVAADQLKVADGVVSAPTAARSVTANSIPISIGKRRPRRRRSRRRATRSWENPFARFDIPAKVTGGLVFVQDMRPAGMLHGRVIRPPRYGSKLDSADEAAAKAMPGVVAVVRDGSFLGVVAEREEQAIKAREALRKSAKWTLGPELPDPARIFEVIKSLPSKDATIGVKQGAAPADARTFEAVYTKPYMSHGSIGPSCAVARVQGWQMTVWTHSQGVFPLRAELVKVLKMPAAAIRCVHVEGSGCYGHNGADDVAADAALLARAVPGRPVRLQWMRDDEFGWEPYGPAMVMQRQGGARTAMARSPTGNTRYGATATRRGRNRPTAPTCWRLVSRRAAEDGTADEPAATCRRRRPQRHSALRLPEPAGGPPFRPGHADPRLGAAHAGRLCQRVRARILHG